MLAFLPQRRWQPERPLLAAFDRTPAIKDQHTVWRIVQQILELVGNRKQNGCVKAVATAKFMERHE